ncbi:hypothetical protein, partial [Leptospira santarosai]|uniref:hypothetical protein n=1 Tax=Leptospira santarosai TaxID=28183 RepID=UPI0024AF1E3B
DNQTVSITVAPQDYSSEYRQKEYLEIIKLFESLFNKEYYDDIQKEVEALNKSLKGKSLTFSSLEHGSIHKLSETYDTTSGFDGSYLKRLKKNSKNKELYLAEFFFPLTDENTGYGQIPMDINLFISERPRLEIVTITSHERQSLKILDPLKQFTVFGKIDHIGYAYGGPSYRMDILTIFIK